MKEMREPRPLLQSSEQRLVDEMMEGYVTWREACAAVETSYELFGRAAGPERKLAFTAYCAALDREEKAAQEYRRIVELLPGA